jgi:hypothetical protein
METLIKPAKVLAVDTERTGEIIEVDSHYEITAEQSQVLRYAYRDGALARNSEAIGKKDSTSVFISKQFLERLLEAADEAESVGSFLNPGVLVHWAAFPMDYPDDLLAGRHTIVVETGNATWIANGFPCPPLCGSGGPGVCKQPM